MWRFLMYAIGRPYAILWHQKLELYGYTLCVAKGCGQVCATTSHAASGLPCASCEPAWGPVTAQQWFIMHLCQNAQEAPYRAVMEQRVGMLVVPSSPMTL